MDIPCNILSRLINIDIDREAYTLLYDNVKHSVIRALKQDHDFKELFNQTVIAGSYADKLKISKPDEFDLVMIFLLPEIDCVTIQKDEKNKGNVFILLNVVLNKLRAENNNIMYHFLKKLVDKDGFLLENKFQQWMHSSMDKALNIIGRKIIHEKEEYNLTYRKSGPAHTIYVQNIKENEPIFSVDFVPAFQFDESKKVTEKPLQTEFWEAIPRPLKSSRQRDNTSFRTSYADSERKLLINRHSLKTALKFMKKFRDQEPKLGHLKSYYIKTLFLWMNEEVEDSFWRQRIFVILRKAFLQLEKALREKKILFYWDTDLNMLKTLRDTQIEQMHHLIVTFNRFLDQPTSRKRLLKYFLSPDELDKVTAEEQGLIADSLDETDVFMD